MNFEQLKQLSNNGKSGETVFDDPDLVITTIKNQINEFNQTKFDSPQQRKRKSKQIAKVIRFLNRVPSMKNKKQRMKDLLNSIK